MDTTARRLDLATQLERVAENIRYAHDAHDFDNALAELHLIGRDVNGYHARTLEALYAEEEAEEYAPTVEAVSIHKVCRRCGVRIPVRDNACEAHQ